MPRLKGGFSAIELWILNGYARRLPKNYIEESVGFEPTGLFTPYCFQDSCHQPLGQQSVASNGFEPFFSVSETDVLPLDDNALNLLSLRWRLT